ncbi:MAG: type I-C CRISPR-associated endonuclease Cas1 [Lachnospiraceae bacterium]|nr:type I-C CRISPR-associated endonuclease Cas1 [Lachnospiraceae bacterium]
MRHLLNTLYVLTPENFLSLDNDNVVVKKGSDEIARFPLHTLESIFCFTYNGATPALMGACADKGINLVFYSPFGKFLARTVGWERGNVLLRMSQFRISDDKSTSLKYGKNFIIGKIYNSKWVIERGTRDHPDRVPVDKLKNASQYLSEAMIEVKDCTDLDELQGIEGKAAQVYFSCFNNLILQQKDDFSFDTRNRRPPMDKVNALLSFAYSILIHDCEAALEGVGLDPYMGFIHRNRPGRCSLALDLIEEFRASYADRFVLYCINQRIIHANDFDIQDSGAVRLNEKGRKKFLAEWQNRKKETLTHPFLNEKINWGLVPYAQALLLARTLRGDLDEYPPFFWK